MEPQSQTQLSNFHFHFVTIKKIPYFLKICRKKNFIMTDTVKFLTPFFLVKQLFLYMTLIM